MRFPRRGVSWRDRRNLNSCFCVSRLVRDDSKVLNRVAEQVGRNLKPCNKNKSIIALAADEAEEDELYEALQVLRSTAR